MSTLAKHTFIAAMALLLAGPLLLFGEAWIVGSAALQQALPISVLAAVFFATMLLEQYALRYLRRAKDGKGVTGFYLLSKMLRLLLAIAMLLAYALAIRTNIVLFAVNLFVCYIITVVLSSIFCVKGEQKGKTTIQ